MSARIVAACAVLVLAALAGVALAATPPAWPSVAEVRAFTPELGQKDAACIARFYHGRLSRQAWLTPYYKLTRAQKAVTDDGFSRCMSPARRAALIERQDTLYFGAHPAELRCTAQRMAARSKQLLLSITSLEQAIREDDRIYRACRLIGALYAALGHSTQLQITPAEQVCTNRIGSADPLRRRTETPTAAQREAVGAVLDRCVGRASEEAMWRRLLTGFRPQGAIPCVAQHSLGITFVTLFSDGGELKRQARSATTACQLAPAPK